MADSYQISISDKPLKSLKKIPNPWRLRISNVIDELEKNPWLGFKMWGEMQGKRKIRVWPYRVIYTVDEINKLVKIVEIGHRGHMSYK